MLNLETRRDEFFLRGEISDFFGDFRYNHHLMGFCTLAPGATLDSGSLQKCTPLLECFDFRLARANGNQYCIAQCLEACTTTEFSRDIQTGAGEYGIFFAEMIVRKKESIKVVRQKSVYPNSYLLWDIGKFIFSRT